MPEKETNPNDPRYNAVTDARDGETKYPEPFPDTETDEDEPNNYEIGK